jgi:hypothetical protein
MNDCVIRNDVLLRKLHELLRVCCGFGSGGDFKHVEALVWCCERVIAMMQNTAHVIFCKAIPQFEQRNMDGTDLSRLHLPMQRPLVRQAAQLVFEKEAADAEVDDDMAGEAIKSIINAK